MENNITDQLDKSKEYITKYNGYSIIKFWMEETTSIQKGWAYKVVIL